MDISNAGVAEGSTGQQQEHEHEEEEFERPVAGPSSIPYVSKNASSTTNASSTSSSKKVSNTRLPIHIPPPSRLLTLTEDIEEAPLQISLQYKVCIPCREAISRCDGHEHFTRACIQCRRRGTKCIWALSRRRREARKDGIDDGDGVPAESNVVEDNTGTSASEDEIQELPAGQRRRTANTAVSTQPAFSSSETEKKERLKKRGVPSAGWETIGKVTKKKGVTDVKGKGKARAASQNNEEDEEDINRNSVLELNDDQDEEDEYLAKEGETQEYQAIISQLRNTSSGLKYIEYSNYTALLKSIFAEESSNLSNSIYWWEFSESAKNIRKNWSSKMQFMNDKKQWRKLNYLDMLLLENVHNWSLWPRPPHLHHSKLQAPVISSDNTVMQSTYPPAALDDNRFISSLPEAIISTSLSLLSKSTLPDEIIKSMTPMHIKFWTQNKRDFGISYHRKLSKTSLFRSKARSGNNKGTFDVSSSHYSEDDFVKRYLNRDELILDMVDDLGPPTAGTVMKAIDSVLLKIASLREKKGMRKPPSEKRNKSDKPGKDKTRKDKSVGADDSTTEVPSGSSKSSKGKGRAIDQDAHGSSTEQMYRADSTAASEVEAGTGGNSNVEEESGDDQDEESQENRKKRRNMKNRQELVNWEKIILAAIMVPGLPRR